MCVRFQSSEEDAIFAEIILELRDKGWSVETIALALGQTKERVAYILEKEGARIAEY